MAKVIDDKITLEVEAVKEKLEIDKATKDKSLLEVNNSTLWLSGIEAWHGTNFWSKIFVEETIGLYAVQLVKSH